MNMNGGWKGIFDTGTMKVTYILRVEHDINGKLNATIASPEQHFIVPVDTIAVQNQTLTFEVKHRQTSYEGSIDKNGTAITGTLIQSGQSYPLVFKSGDVQPLIRPQEPKPPYTYHEEKVTYENKEIDVTLAGTLTVPQGNGPFPAVILIAGTGRHYRDANVCGHKRFLVLADYLTRHGIAVLRFDKRGCGASTGNYKTATDEDFAADVRAGIEYLKTRKEINLKQIGLIGHSTGGIIAPMVAAQSKDVAFIVMMAGPGVNGKEISLEIQALFGRAMGATEEEIAIAQKLESQLLDIVKEEVDPNVAEKKQSIARAEYLSKLSEPQRQAAEGSSIEFPETSHPWARHFLTFEPASALQKITVPILALFCELDLWVSPEQNIKPVSKALEAAGNKDYTVLLLPKLNHFFQHAKTGLPNECIRIEETIAPEVLKIISEWILARTVKKQIKDLKNTDRWNAAYYKKNSGKQFQTGMDVLNAMQFKEDEIVLDVGCGDGRLTAEIAKRVPKGNVLGIDSSANMIHEAQKTFCGIPNVSFECIDATKFDAQNRFDRAISFDTFHWIDDQLKALENIYAALKPGGNLYIKMISSNKPPIFEAMESAKWSHVLQSSKAFFQGLSPETIRPLLEQCGFVNIDAHTQATESVFKNQKELSDWLMGWVPHATGLAEDRAQEFVSDVTQAAKKAPGDLVTIGYSLHVRAQKP